MNHENQTFQKELHIAPMINVSTREFRYFFRLLTKHAIIWTEMVMDERLYYASKSDSANGCLEYDTVMEHPVVFQIGGTQPYMTTVAARCAHEAHYDEINLNMGCPGTKVKHKQCGAVLMKDAHRACELVQAVCDGVRAEIDPETDHPATCSTATRISVKCRIGVDDHEDESYLHEWIAALRHAGCRRFYLHSRKCLLEGLTPSQNRHVPPLKYPVVYRLCETFPDCDFWINGGITTLQAAKRILTGSHANDDDYDRHAVPCVLCGHDNGSCTVPPRETPTNLKGCMMGRAATNHPAQFADVDRYIYGASNNPYDTRRQVFAAYREYLERTYPRRCCDDCNERTSRIPAPVVVHTQPHCAICGSRDSVLDTTVDPLERTSTNAPKMAYAVIQRSLDPVRNLFYALPVANAFRQACFRLLQNRSVRNCGPSFILRQALLVVPDEYLDCPFERFED